MNDVSFSNDVITHKIATMHRHVNTTNGNVPQYHVETLTVKKVRDLAASGMINIEDLSIRRNNGKTKMPELFSASDMIANFQHFGLVPVQHPDLGTSMKHGFEVMDKPDDNNSARNKKNAATGNTPSNTKRSQLKRIVKHIRNKIKKVSTSAREENIVANERMKDIGGKKTDGKFRARRKKTTGRIMGYGYIKYRRFPLIAKRWIARWCPCC